MCCCLIAIALIIAGKLVAIALIWALKRRAKEAQDDPEEGKFHFESLPEVFDFEGRSPCSRLTARHAYLLRLSYGDRGRGFYIPRAIISISFLDSAQPEPVGRATLGPDLLTANHRSYHNTAHPRFSQKPFLLFVLLKRRTPLGHADLVLLNHNEHLCTIFINSLFLVRLADQAVFGARIHQEIRCQPDGLQLPPQVFPLQQAPSPSPSSPPTFRLFDAHHLIGPRRGLNAEETAITATTSFIYEKSKAEESESKFAPYDELRFEVLTSRALALSVLVALGAWAAMLLAIAVYHFLVKRFLNSLLNVGLYSLLNDCITVLLFLISCGIGIGSLSLEVYKLLTFFYFLRRLHHLSTSGADGSLDGDSGEAARAKRTFPSLPSFRQEKLWLLAVVSAASIYLLLAAALVMVLSLHGYYQTVNLSSLDFEGLGRGGVLRRREKHKATTTTAITTTTTIPIDSLLLQRPKSNFSLRNISLSTASTESVPPPSAEDLANTTTTTTTTTTSSSSPPSSS
ncbi:hypothetical protein TYRP_011722 [Tyrophagus putrescentiae]|nr:hypothetical protein TYRP_011722 [Tyrophagus putrescentiae]